MALSNDNHELIVSLEQPVQAEVRAGARSFIEFAPFDETLSYRVRHWLLELRPAKELYAPHDEQQLEAEGKRNGLTICGLPLGVVM